MAKFKKEIVKAGVYNVATVGGGRRFDALPPERLVHWANTYRKMKSTGTGYRIPAPWNHDLNAKPVALARGKAPRSDNNAGFWDDFWVEPNEEGVPTLYGYLDSPGDPNDPNTPAGKVGTLVKETSIYAEPVFEDGKGNKFEDVLFHVALVTHPIEPGQKNFELVNENGGVAIAMSHFAYALGDRSSLMANEAFELPASHETEEDSDPEDADPSKIKNASDSNIKVLLDALRSVGIDLPDDTNDENLKERLLVAVRQHQACQKNDDDDEEYGEKAGNKHKGDLNKPPKGAVEDAAGTIMSTTTQPAALDETTLMSHPVVKSLQDQNAGLRNYITVTEKANRQRRIDALIATGRVTKAYADAHLLPLLNGFTMSFEANAAPGPLDATLVALEAIPAAPSKASAGNIPFATPQAQMAASFLMSSSAPHGSETPTDPFAAPQQLSEEDASAAAAQIASSIKVR